VNLNVKELHKIQKQIAIDFFYWWHNQPGCNTDSGFDKWWCDNSHKYPPCSECGALTLSEAETMCICNGDKDDCHGCHLWDG
jgi:hypothetical protein